jgi:transposase
VCHLYRTGRLRRTHLRGHVNILKRLLIHAGGANLALLMRTFFGVGTPRGLQGRVAAVDVALWHVLVTVITVFDRWTIPNTSTVRVPHATIEFA